MKEIGTLEAELRELGPGKKVKIFTANRFYVGKIGRFGIDFVVIDSEAVNIMIRIALIESWMGLYTNTP